MGIFATLESRNYRLSTWQSVVLSSAFLAGTFCSNSFTVAQSPSQAPDSPTTPNAQQPRTGQPHSHKLLKKQEPAPAPIVQTPPPPPMPDWPVNNKPNPASVIWDSNGLRIDASNSSLQQILNEVSTETGSKVEGLGADQRVYGAYGPGQARDVLSQLLQGSGYNVLLAGDIGQGAPREIVLSPSQSGASKSPNSANRTPQDPDDDVAEPQPEEPPQPPQTQSGPRPGFGPNGPIRTPQQVMEEMQQRQQQQQLQLQQQQQQQQQQGTPQTNPQ